MIRSGYQAQVTPAFRVLSEDQICDIHDASMEILRRTGVRVFSEDAVALLIRAGASVADGNLVRIPAHMIEWALRVAPRDIAVCNRDGEVAMHLGGRRTYFGTGSDTPNVLDPRTGERRRALLRDVADFAKVCDALSNIDFIMSMGIASDLPPTRSELPHLYAMVGNTTKPVVYTATTVEVARLCIDLLETVAGSPQAFRENPFGVLYIEPVSPLSFAPEPMGKLLLAAEKGIPCIFMSGMLGGGTGPITLAGGLALANAESLAGVLIAQLKREGAPVISGGGILPMDMATCVASYAAPEFMLSVAAIAEIARHYGLPSWGYAGCTDAKVFDEQAAADAAHWVLMAALAGSNLVHDIGYVESGLASSFDMLVFTDEMIGKVKHLLGGVRVDEDTLALDAIQRVGPGGHFLNDEHTLKHFRSNWFPTLEDRRNYDGWATAGSKTMRERVNSKVRLILDGHQPVTISPDVDRAVRSLLPGQSSPSGAYADAALT